MTIKDLKTNNSLLLKCISGSRSYGLNTPQSDTDLKGVFILPKFEFYGLSYTEQVNNESNDEVYYELKRFVDLLVKNNPNLLELLNIPKDCILFRNPILDLLKPEDFLSKLCKQSFAGYAQAQIKKAKGLNIKIINPVDKERKSVLDFCYIVNNQKSITLKSWLEQNNFQQEDCGLVNIPHMREIYALFHKDQMENSTLKGISSGIKANDISLSSVEKGVKALAILSFNKDGYSIYCKDYKEYWDWVAKRNKVRYESTLESDKNYDSKNLMHTFRLLNMAEEIAKYGEINVRRKDRDFLLQIRSGVFTYEKLVNLANEKILEIDVLFEKSTLMESPDVKKAEQILFEMREYMYK